MADAKMIESHVDNGIAVLEINRPPVNSYTTELLKEFDAAILDARFNDDVHALVITGKVEKFFSAGADINMLSKQSLGFKNNFALHGHEVLMRLENTPKIVIAAINGHAVGGGLEIAMACDIRIASESARFCTQFIKLGIGGCDIGVSYTLPRIIGAGPAFDLILTARAVDADEALRLGIVSRLSDTVVEDALAIAETLCGYGKFGVESTKQVMWANLEAGSLESALHLENRSQILAGAGGMLSEATEAFRHRRR